jgi:RsiW-degrading membrane proteinase PrsW (M82 family)
MATIIFVVPLERLAATSMPAVMDFIEFFAEISSFIVPPDKTVQIILWAFIEEFLKYTAVLFIAFKSKHFDEPIDAIIYLITAALGFAAIENTLYLLKGLGEGGIWNAALESSLRFLGATILHIAASAIVGIMIAFSFYKNKFIKLIAVIFGLLGATLLHTYFNLSIIDIEGTVPVIAIFSRFWIVVIGIIILINIVKLIKPKISSAS